MPKETKQHHWRSGSAADASGKPREASERRSVAAIDTAALYPDRLLFLASCLPVIFQSKLIFCSRGEMANDIRPLLLM